MCSICREEPLLTVSLFFPLYYDWLLILEKSKVTWYVALGSISDQPILHCLLQCRLECLVVFVDSDVLVVTSFVTVVLRHWNSHLIDGRIWRQEDQFGCRVSTVDDCWNCFNLFFHRYCDLERRNLHFYLIHHDRPNLLTALSSSLCLRLNWVIQFSSLEVEARIALLEAYVSRIDGLDLWLLIHNRIQVLRILPTKDNRINMNAFLI